MKKLLFRFAGAWALALLLGAGAGCEVTDDPATFEQPENPAAQAAAGNQGNQQEGPAPTSVSLGTRGEGGGFVWKPISESDGRLVVLLPPQYRGRVRATFLAHGDGTVIEMGRFSGDDINGNRPHYRFSRPGAGYGQNLFVVSDLTDGHTVHWPIANGASRVDL